MFGPVLKLERETRLCYSTSTSFRIMCFSSGAMLLYLILKEAEQPFDLNSNLVALSITLICFVSAMYLERSVFDKESNKFEKHFGLFFIYSRLSRPLNSLESVSLKEFNSNSSEANDGKPAMMSRKYASLTVVTANKEIIKIDMAKSSGTKELLKTAEEISKFCEIQLVNN